MSSNGAIGSSGTVPASGYFLLNFIVQFLCFIVPAVCFMFMTNTMMDHVPVYIILIVMFYSIFRIKLNRKMPLIPTIQKLDRAFLVAGFAAQLKPNVFDGINYKRWVGRLELWLTAMNVWFITNERPVGPHTSAEDSVYMSDDNLFKGAVISVLAENLVESYMQHPSSKALWDALEANFGVSDVGSELYIMEQFYDYKMVDDRAMVKQADELQALAQDLDNLRCPLSDKFVAGGIIAKLPPS